MSDIRAVKTPAPEPDPARSPDTAQPRPRALTIGTIVLVVAAVLGVVALALGRRGAEARERQARAVAQDSGPVVRLAPVELSSAERTLGIPGEVRAWSQATLYSKVAGYVREVLVDKGGRVKKGQLLARLESPETDQQVLGARSDVQLKRVQAERARKLRPQGFIAQQDLDNAESALQVSRATLQQLLALQSYEQVRAPFDGVVIARYVDPGALVAAGTASNQAVQPLFDVADMGAWGRDQKTVGKIRMLADGSAIWTRALGLEQDLTPKGMNPPATSWCAPRSVRTPKLPLRTYARTKALCTSGGAVSPGPAEQRTSWTSSPSPANRRLAWRCALMGSRRSVTTAGTTGLGNLAVQFRNSIPNSHEPAMGRPSASRAGT